MKLWRKIRGVATVEFAILLVPLVMMAFGMTELGRAYYYYNTVLKSTRDAARYLSMVPAHTGEAEARCLAVHGNANCSGGVLLPGLETGMVDFTYLPSQPTGSGSIDMVTVTLTGAPFTSFVPMVVQDMVFAPIECTMRQGGS